VGIASFVDTKNERNNERRVGLGGKITGRTNERTKRWATKEDTFSVPLLLISLSQRPRKEGPDARRVASGGRTRTESDDSNNKRGEPGTSQILGEPKREPLLEWTD